MWRASMRLGSRGARTVRRARMAGRMVRQLFDADVICERLDAVYREVIDCSVAEGRRSA